MNSTVAGSPMAFARSSGRGGAVHIDTVTIALVLAISLLGLVMVTSASVSIASKESGQTFFYLERQLLLMLVGGGCAALVFCVRTELLERLSFPLLITALALLFAVLVPGLGHSVNGSRRWLRIVSFNFQVSELARVLVLIFIASYAARREEELRGTFLGLAKPLGLLCLAGAFLLAEPDFGAATVLFATGFGILFLAGARLRYVIAMMLFAVAGFGVLAVSSGYRLRRLKAFLDPWADPYNTGFQLTQSLIAIGRGQWFGVGLGDSVQKLFYLPEAHTDFLFAVLAEELGLAGRAADVGAVHRPHLAQLLHRAPRIGCGTQVPGVPRGGLRPVGGHPGVHQHWREHGCAADERSDAAAHELRPFEPHCLARLGGPAASGLSRGDAREPGLGHRSTSD